jgi:hypothetical protein
VAKLRNMLFQGLYLLLDLARIGMVRDPLVIYFFEHGKLELTPDRPEVVSDHMIAPALARLHQLNREHDGDRAPRLSQREAMAKCCDGAALDGRWNDGSG